MFEGAPDGKKPFGTESSRNGDDGHLLIGALRLESKALLGTLPGSLELGAWRHTGETPELPTEGGQTELRTYHENHGYYAVLDQKLYAPGGIEERGLSVFAQIGWAPQDRNEARIYAGGGLAFTGAIPTRDSDVVAAGIAHVELGRSPRAIDGLSSETLFELTYAFRATGFLSVQPDFQYFHRPGGGATPASATVAGVRVVTTL